MSQLVSRDPAHTIKLTTVIMEAMNHAQQLNGGPELFQQQYLHDVDPNVLREFRDFATGVAKGGD